MAAVIQPRFGAVDQVAITRQARARRRLIRAHDNASNARVIVQRLERDDHLRRRAVRAGNQALMFANSFGVDFRNDKRNVRIHAPVAGFVDDYLDAFARLGDKIARDVVRRRRDNEIDSVERFGAKFFDDHASVVERNRTARAALRRQKLHLLIGKLALLKHANDQRSHRARRAYYRYVVVHDCLLKNTFVLFF